MTLGLVVVAGLVLAGPLSKRCGALAGIGICAQSVTRQADTAPSSTGPAEVLKLTDPAAPPPPPIQPVVLAPVAAPPRPVVRAAPSRPKPRVVVRKKVVKSDESDDESGNDEQNSDNSDNSDNSNNSDE